VSFITAGPKITFMAPDNFMEKEVFDTVASYIIPKPDLKGHLITVTTRDYKIVGCPVVMEDSKKYERNNLMFNLCFVCTAQSKTKPIEPVVRKLADYLTTLETESGFISNESTKPDIQGLIQRILEDLNQTRRCSITVNKSVTIYLKVVDRSPTGDTDSICPPEPGCHVREHDVPIFKPEFATLNSEGLLDFERETDGLVKGQASLDMTTKLIIPFIDGFRHVKKISFEVDVDINLVKICLQNLLQFGYIIIIPIFLYSNVYVATNELDRLASEPDLWAKCRAFVVKGVSAEDQMALFSKSNTPLPNFTDVFSIFCSMNMGVRIKDLCMRHSKNFALVDVKHLVQFGLIYGLIRCVKKYPCLLPGENGSKRLRHLAVARWLNGDHSLDEISCRTGFDFQELEEIVDEDPGIVTVMR